jgi:hypothetical protein
MNSVDHSALGRRYTANINKQLPIHGRKKKQYQRESSGPPLSPGIQKFNRRKAYYGSFLEIKTYKCTNKRNFFLTYFGWLIKLAEGVLIW